MVTINTHYIIKNPTTEKLIDLINNEGINNIPLFIYTVHTTETTPSNDLYEFVYNDQSFYFFGNNIRKTLVYNIDMLPNLVNTHTLFITNLLI